MPNWVRNRMTVKFEKDTFKATGNGMQILNFIMKPLCTEECVFDFEKLSFLSLIPIMRIMIRAKPCILQGRYRKERFRTTPII